MIKKVKSNILALVTILVIALLMILNHSLFQNFQQKQNELNKWVTHTHEVIISSNHLLSSIKDAETGQRGYLLTLKNKYLESYYLGKKEYLIHLNNLKEYTHDNPNQQIKLKHIETLVKNKFDELQLTLDLSKTNIKNAIDLVKNDSGKKIMDQIRLSIDTFKYEEQKLLTIRKKLAIENESSFNKYVSLIIFLELVLITSVLYFISGKQSKLQKKLSNTIQAKQDASFRSHYLAMNESSIVSKSDLKGNITYVNDNFCKVTGYSKEEVIGKPHNLVRHESTPKETFEDLWETIKKKNIWKGVLQNKGKLDDYWVDIVILPILDDKDNIIEYIAVRHDITQMKQQQVTLDNAANTDTLTGYGNRYKLNHDIKESPNPALAILNIDGFSQINDFYGHDKGDIIIKELGDIIFNILKSNTSKLYHLQGDEYVIFNKDVKQDKFIKNIENTTLRVSTTPIKIDGEEIYINLSTAISFEDQSSILSTADMALKIAKKENKNIVIYNDNISLNYQYQNNIKWAKKIKDALEEDRFIPVFQPIVNNKTEKWEKFEALVRLEEDGQLISPYHFLEISKKTKHYTNITKIMINKSFEVFKHRDEEFSINLTMEDILNVNIKRFIFDMLDQYKIGSRVVFEIVESESIENFEQIAIFINCLKKYGCKIAIDDFGTGYSNFEYLMKLQADYIKIDGSMIKDIDTNIQAQMVVSTIVEFAKKMDMKTIAEFVETQSILDKVNELGIDYTQGYFYSEPKKEITS